MKNIDENTSHLEDSLFECGCARRKHHPFPRPIMKLSDRSPLWKWREIVEWLYHNKLKERESLDQAIFLEHINAALEERDSHIRKVRHDIVKQLQ